MPTLKDLLITKSAEIMDSMLAKQEAEQQAALKKQEAEKLAFYQKNGFKNIDELLVWIKAGHRAYVMRGMHDVYLAYNEKVGYYIHTYRNNDIDITVGYINKPLTEGQIRNGIWAKEKEFGKFLSCHKDTKAEQIEERFISVDSEWF